MPEICLNMQIQLYASNMQVYVNMLKYADIIQLYASNMQVYVNNMQEICKKYAIVQPVLVKYALDMQ